MPRFAFRISPEVIDMAAELTGNDSLDFPDDLFVVFEMEESFTKFTGELMSTDQVLEEYKKDSTLQVV